MQQQAEGDEERGRKSKRRRAALQVDISAAMHAWQAAEARMDDPWGARARGADFAGVACTPAPQHLRFDNMPGHLEVTRDRFALQPQAATLLQPQQQQQQWPWGGPLQMGMQPPGATYGGRRPPLPNPLPRQHASSGARMQPPAASGPQVTQPTSSPVARKTAKGSLLSVWRLAAPA
jgi:hypothetical protein